MDIKQLYFLSFIVFLVAIGCSFNNSEQEEIPEFVKNLKQKRKVPDSLSFNLELNMTWISKDTLNVEFLLKNNSNHDITIKHPPKFTRVALYDRSELLYPDPNHANSYVYIDVAHEKKLLAGESISVDSKPLFIPNGKVPKIMGYSVFQIISIDSNKTKKSEEYWLLSNTKNVN